MTFFPQTERKIIIQKIQTPSPCTYSNDFNNNKSKFASAPFGSTEPLKRIGSTTKQKKQQILEKQYEQVFVMNDLTIKIKAQDQKSAAFKSTTSRIPLPIPQDNPGPGQYQLADSRLNKSKSFSSFSFHYKLPNRKTTIPSIPLDNLGFKQDENNQMKKVQATKPQIPHPGSYQLRTNLVAKGVLQWKAQNYRAHQSQKYPGPGEYDNQIRPNKSVSSCFISQTDRFGSIKKIKDQKIPGPGTYNVQKTTNNRLSHNLSSFSFFDSKVPRFQRAINQDSLGPGLYFNETNRLKVHSARNIKRMIKGNDVINKVINKPSTFQINNNNPGPADYRTTLGMSYELHRALLRKQATNTLPKEKRKIFQLKEQDTSPGPGAYQQEPVAKITRATKWKPTSTVNLKHLKPQQQINPPAVQYNNTHNTIQQKVKKMNQKLTLTQEKPFNSGSERFKHYSNQNRAKISSFKVDQKQEDIPDFLRQSSDRKVKRLVMTTIKVRVPFGVSSNKFQQKPLNYEGPDYYNKPSVWVKPTFNIKGKLQ